MYDLITAFISIIVGIISVLFRKQLVVLQKKIVSKHNNYVSRGILDYPVEDAHKMAIFVGIVFIVMGLIKLFRIYHGI